MGKIAVFVLTSILLIAMPSCGSRISFDSDYKDSLKLANKLMAEEAGQLAKNKKELDAERQILEAQLKRWQQKEVSFIQLLSDEELRALSDLLRADREGEAIQVVLARRKLLRLLIEPSKVNTFTSLWQEFQDMRAKESTLAEKAKYLNERLKKQEEYWTMVNKESKSKEAKHIIIDNEFWNWHYQNQSLFQQQMMNQQLWLLNNTPRR